MNASLRMGQEAKRSRVVDQTNKLARISVADVIGKMTPWRRQLAQMHAAAARPMSKSDCERYLKTHSEIVAGVAEARTVLIASLMDAPPKIAGHSRVADVEKALDGVEAQLAQLQAQLD